MTKRTTYRTYLRAAGVKPVPLRQPAPRANGAIELLPGGKVGIWQNGRMELRQRA